MNAAPDSRRLLSDMVVASPVLSEDRGDRDQAMADITNNAGPSGASDFDEYGGVDPNLDPELAMVSLQNQSDINQAISNSIFAGSPHVIRRRTCETRSRRGSRSRLFHFQAF